MREIRFRAWDGKELLSWDHATIGDYDLLNLPSIGEAFAALTKRYPLMQFTGLKDKNGKEIYEGDIVMGVVKRVQLLTGDNDENCSNAMGGFVEWDYNGYILRAIHSMCDPHRSGMAKWFAFQDVDDGDFDEIEIIGNIYENPELLK